MNTINTVAEHKAYVDAQRVARARAMKLKKDLMFEIDCYLEAKVEREIAWELRCKKSYKLADEQVEDYIDDIKRMMEQ